MTNNKSRAKGWGRGLTLLFSLCINIATSAESPISPFTQKHCLDCHSKENPKADLNLETLSYDLTDPKTFARWVKIHDRVRAGEMPPKSEARPDAAELTKSMDALSAQLTAADLARRGAEGRATVRRLTRTELEYTLQDVFALPGMPIKDDLPEDGTAAGFDKVSEALDISHIQMARYMDAARFVLDRAVATRPEPPKPLKLHMLPQNEPTFWYGLWQGECVLLKDKRLDPALPLFSERCPRDKQTFLTEAVVKPSKSAIGMFRSVDESWNPGFPHFSPMLPGRYKMRVSVWSFFWDKDKVLPPKKPQVATIRNEVGEVVYLDAPSLESKVHEFEMWLEPNEKLSYDISSMEHIEMYSRKGQHTTYSGPGIAVDWLDVEGPLYETWPPESHKRIFGDLPLKQLPKPEKSSPPIPPSPHPPIAVSPKQPPRLAPPTDRRRDSSLPPNFQVHGRVDGIWTVASENPKEDAAKLLKPILTRLFRRPVTDAQFKRYLALVHERLAANETLEEALRTAITGAICSPEFLFRLEKPGKLDDYAVANRLSYFLTCSAPDQELLDAAARGELKRGGDSVRHHVRRLLNDPRSERFVNDFLNQWLALKEINATTPDKHLYPDYIPYMQNCMVGETRAYFRKMLDANLGVRNFVNSDFAMLNAKLCELYNLDLGLTGHDFQMVSLPKDSHRGGLLTQAAILKITANGTNTSPVKRGAWVIDRLQGRPPDPPPASVTAVEPDLRGAQTIRQQLDAHRNNVSCAACHKRIDPPGFALESYDVIGRFRERYRTKELGDKVSAKVGEGHHPVNYRLGPPVDCTGQTLDGEAFKDIEEFKTLLLKDERQIARNFLRRLATYATGREITFADRPAIEAILDACLAKDPNETAAFGNYRLRKLFDELCASELFLTK